MQASPASASNTVEYGCLADLDLYDDSNCTRLATQAASGRQLRIVSIVDGSAVEVCLCEDDYPCWLSWEDLGLLELAENSYRAIAISAADIQKRLPEAIAFTHHAMTQPNYYRWGGTVAPNYDCSGLMQAAFASVGIWLPRDSYQQEAFTQSIPITQLQPADLIFFGSAQRTTHVGLYLGESRYIHSSGKQQGRNGIGIDRLSERGDAVSQAYYRQLRGAGRVITSYQPRILSSQTIYRPQK